MSVPSAPRVAPRTRPGSARLRRSRRSSDSGVLAERVAGRVAVRLRVEDPDPGAVGDHHRALRAVVLEADAARLLQVEGAGLRRAVRVGLAEAALGAAQRLQVAVDRRDVDLRRRRSGGDEGQGAEREEQGSSVHAPHIPAGRGGCTLPSGHVCATGCRVQTRSRRPPTPALLGAVVAAIVGAAVLEPVADDPGAAVGAGRARAPGSRIRSCRRCGSCPRSSPGTPCRSRCRRSRRLP